jgi:hypothetical protein
MSVGLDVSRLSLCVGPMSENDARHLAERVAALLGRLPITADTASEPVSASVTAAPGSTIDEIADGVVAAVAAALRLDGVS